MEVKKPIHISQHEEEGKATSEVAESWQHIVDGRRLFREIGSTDTREYRNYINMQKKKERENKNTSNQYTHHHHHIHYEDGWESVRVRERGLDPELELVRRARGFR